MDGRHRAFSSDGEIAPRTAAALRKRDRWGPDAVTVDDLMAWFGANPHWAPEYRRSLRSGLRGFFGWAHKRGRLSCDPAAELPPFVSGVTAPRPADESAYREALSHADLRLTLILRLAAEAGLRRAEVAQVHTRDLSHGPDGAQLLIHGKGRKERVVPIPDDLAALISLGAEGHTPGAPSTGWLFPSRKGGHLIPKSVGVLCRDALPGIWSMHNLRHRFATRAYRGSRDIRAVQELLGHSSVATTQRYTAVDDNAMRAAMMAAKLVT